MTETTSPEPALDTRVRAAVIGARDFLLQHQRPNGMWVDFHLAPGWSDEWVTGFVGDRLSHVEGTQSALARGWGALRDRTSVRPAGWGFNAIVPQDADSTSWALRLGTRVGAQDTPEFTRARSSLSDFRHDSGLLGTYGPTEAIRRFIGADDTRGFSGWTCPHACVSAAAAALPGTVDIDALVRAQEPDGRWRSYWWESDSFATALAAEAIGGGDAVIRAGAWAQRVLAQAAHLSPFDTANLLAVMAIAQETGSAEARSAAASLVACPLPDGSWPGTAVMRVPDPDDPNPDARAAWVPGGRIEGAVVTDRRRHFTTATAMWALSLFVDGVRT